MSKQSKEQESNLKGFIDHSPVDLNVMEFCLRLDQLTDLENLSSDCRGALQFTSGNLRHWSLEITALMTDDLETMIEVLENLTLKITEIKKAVD